MNEAGPDKPPEDLKAPTLGSILTSEGFARQDRLFDDAADKALMARPTFDIRTRLQLTLIIFFLFPLGSSIWAIVTMARLEEKIGFLEVAEDYAEEILEARRYEKTYLLYGTNLVDAREHAQAAAALPTRYTEEFRRAVGEQSLATMNRHLTSYSRLLSELEEGVGSPRQEELRRHGAALVELAQDFLSTERIEIGEIIALARLVPLILLAILLVLMVVVFHFLYRVIHGGLTRFVDYTQRIARGDFTPITPARGYRDEFSVLALMTNRMIRELDRQHRVLVESHKLRAMGTLVAGVAHELNNPMNNMLLTASLLEEEYDSLDDDERQEMLRDLTSQAERTKAIVRNLLDFARESETKLESIDVRKLVDQTVKLVGNQAKMKKVRLTVDLPERSSTVHGDQQLLSQVFMNLILNAIEVMPERGEIRISSDTERRDGFLAVDVADNGPGIPAHAMNQIFDPFFTTKPKGKGTGLGLSVSRGIIRKLGGYLLVESTLGEGSTFTVLLPITAMPSDISTGTARTDTSGTRPAAGEER